MTKKIIDPVVCSGGPLGGTVVEGKDWPVGEEKTLPGEGDAAWLYRRTTFDDEPDTEDQAIFCGPAPR